MRNFIFMTAVAAMLSAPALAPAQTMTLGTAKAIEAAVAEIGQLQEAAYVCRHRFYTSRRVCWWRPGYRGWRWHWRRWR